MAPSPNPTLRYTLLLLFTFLGLLTACGGDAPPPTPVVIVVTATPVPATRVPAATAVPDTATPIPTNTPDAAATASAQAAITALAERAAEIAAAAATATEESRPTETPAPTATPRPGIGSTVQVADWELTVQKTRSREKLVYDTFGDGFAPSGKFWLVYVAARNTANTSRSWRDTLEAGLVDDHNASYDEIWTVGTEDTQTKMARFANLEGANALYAVITPRGTGHFLLAFDVAADALPSQFAVRPAGGNAASWVFVDIK